jgi:ABC-type amino acid transport substrate-binding protein
MSAWRSACLAGAMLVRLGATDAAEPDADAPPALRVGVAPMVAAAEWAGDQPSGVMIDTWATLADRLGVRTEFVRVATPADLCDALIASRIDVALGPLAITEEREKSFDCTHPLFHTGLRIGVRQRTNTGILAALGSLLSWQLGLLVTAVVGLVLLSGHLLWWFERDGNERSFPRGYPGGVWEAMWWIGSVIVTGGCDDKHVDSPRGRVLAFLWMIGGIGLIATFTSLLTATMTAERVAGTIRGPRDLVGRTVSCQRRSPMADTMRQRGAIVMEHDTLHTAADALVLGMVDAVVGENQQMMALVSQGKHPGVMLVGPIFESFDCGLGLPPGSPLRERLNKAILAIREDGSFDRIRDRWLGRHD